MRPSVVILAGCVMFLSGLYSGGVLKEADLEKVRRQAGEEAERMVRQIHGMEATVSDLTRQRDDAQTLVAAKEQDARDLERKVGDTNAKLAAALKARVEAPPDKESAQKPMKLVADMMKTPGMKEVIMQQQLAQIEMFYGGLFKRLNLSEADREDLKKLIGERIQAESEFGIRAMGGEIAEKDRQLALKDLLQAKNAVDLKIKTFLNNDQDYLAYQNWEQAKPERIALSMGVSAFSASGEPLTGAQEDQLVNAMFHARTSRTDVPDLTRVENVSPEVLARLSMEKILTGYDAQAQEVAANAASFLSPKQLEALKAMQLQQRALQEAGLKMLSGSKR